MSDASTSRRLHCKAGPSPLHVRARSRIGCFDSCPAQLAAGARRNRTDRAEWRIIIASSGSTAVISCWNCRAAMLSRPEGTSVCSGRIDSRRGSRVPRGHCARGTIDHRARLAGIGQEGPDESVQSSLDRQHVVECLPGMGGEDGQRFVSDRDNWGREISVPGTQTSVTWKYCSSLLIVTVGTGRGSDSSPAPHRRRAASPTRRQPIRCLGRAETENRRRRRPCARSS